MKNMRFTQVVSVTVTLEAEIPDDWTDEQIDDFAQNCVTNITVDNPDALGLFDDMDYKISNICVDGANILEAYVWGVN